MFDMIANALELAGIAYLIFLGHGIPATVAAALSKAGTTVATEAKLVVTDIRNVVDPKATVAVAAAPAPVAIPRGGGCSLTTAP